MRTDPHLCAVLGCPRDAVSCGHCASHRRAQLRAEQAGLPPPDLAPLQRRGVPLVRLGSIRVVEPCAAALAATAAGQGSAASGARAIIEAWWEREQLRRRSVCAR